MDTNKSLKFKSYNLKGITDSTTIDWNSKRYIGRAEEVYYYVGAATRINFSFSVVPMSAREIQPLWRKLNALKGFAWPRYLPPNADRTGFMSAPFIKLTIGDLYKELPCVIDSINCNMSDEMGWNIDIDWDYVLSHAPRKSDGTLDTDVLLRRLPNKVDVDISVKYIGKERPKSGASFFADRNFLA